MDTFQHCQICTKTNAVPKEEIVVVATFSQQLYARQACAAIEESHIVPLWQTILSKEEIHEKSNGKLMDVPTLILALHGIKDIVKMQTLYVESICQRYGSLSFDVLSQKAWQSFQKLIA